MKPAYIFIISGILLASSRFLFEEYSQLLLILGMMLLMIGIYLISRSLPPKRQEDFEQKIFPPHTKKEPEESKNS